MRGIVGGGGAAEEGGGIMTEDVEACGNSMGRGWGSARCAVWDPDGLGGWMGAERGAALLGLRDVFLYSYCVRGRRIVKYSL